MEAALQIQNLRAGDDSTQNPQPALNSLTLIQGDCLVPTPDTCLFLKTCHYGRGGYLSKGPGMLLY